MSLKGKEPASNAPREKEQLRKVIVYADNFQMATNAVAKFNHEKPLKDTVQLENDGFYAFFENWQSRNSAQESASGLAHVRLIIGQYKCGSGELGKPFVGHGYDLTKPPEDIPIYKKVYGAPWKPYVEYFWADHYFSESKNYIPGDKNGWLRVSRPNTYVYGGKVRSELCRRPGRDLLEYLKGQGK